MTKRTILVLTATTLATLAMLVLLAVTSPASGARVAPQEPQEQPLTFPKLDTPIQVPKSPAAPASIATVLQTTPTYTVSDSLTGDVVYDWVDIRDSGTVAPLVSEDGGSELVDIGFYFPFYHGLYRQFRVSTNGYIYFDGTMSAGAAIPIFIPNAGAPNNFIAPFGTELYMYPGISRIYVDRQATRTVIAFVDVQWCCGLNDPHTFEIILYPDGRILTQYRQIRYLSNRNAYVVVGIEDEGGGDGEEYYRDWFGENPQLDNELAVLYDPGDSVLGHLILQPAAQTWWDDPGETGQFNVDVINMTYLSNTFDVSYSINISSSVVPDPAQWPVDLPAQIGPINSISTETFQVSVTIPALADWSDMATLSVTVTSLSPPLISGTVFINYGVAQRDLSITKTLAPDIPPGPGGDFRYQLTVSNQDYMDSGRAAQARGVVVTDTLPNNAELLGFEPAGSVTTETVAGHIVFTWTVGSLSANGSEGLLVYMRMPESASVGETVLNEAWTQMSDSIERGPFENNHISYQFNVDSPWLEYDIDKSFPDPDHIGPGQVATFGIWIANEGNVPSAALVITDTLPQGVEFLTTTWPAWDWQVPGEVLRFDLEPLRNGYWNGVSFEISVLVPVTTPIGTLLTNTVAIVDEDARDVEVIEVIDPRGDVWVEKYPELIGGEPVVPEPGGDYTFWLNYGNLGLVSVYSVTLTDTLPFSYVTLLQAGSIDDVEPIFVEPDMVVWQDIPELLPGQYGWVPLRVLIDAGTPDGTQLVNTAEITATLGFNITPINDVDQVTLTLAAADVTVSKSVTPTGELQVEDWLTYTIHFGNTGARQADAVRITDELPEGLGNISWQASGPEIDLVLAEPTRLVWRTVEPLAPWDEGVIEITAQLDPATNWPPLVVLTNTVEIRTSQGEQPINDPNTDFVTNTMRVASPYIVKTGPTLALPGELISYTITYGNGGLLDAEQVQMTDTLPANTSYVSDTSGLTATTGVGWVSWQAGTLVGTGGAQAAPTFTLVVSVSPDTPIGTGLYNTALLTATNYDGNRTDNSSTWLTSVGFDLYNSYKRVNGSDGAWIGPSAPVTYEVVLVNQGPFDAPDVSMWDPLPDDAAYAPNSLAASGGEYGYDPVADVITWTGTVPGNSVITVSFQMTMGYPTPLPNGAVVVNTAYISDSVRSLSPSVPVTVAGPDLSFSSKTVNEPRPAQGELITYTIYVVNEGQVEASARLTDALPLEVSYTGGGSASSGSLGSGYPITWAGVVAANDQVVINLPAIVEAGPNHQFTNTALIDDGAKVTEVSVGVETKAPNLDVLGTAKSATPDSLISGETTTYTITIYNGGDASDPDVQMVDVIEGGFYAGGGYASDGVFDASADPLIRWSGSLAPGEGVDIVIPVVITAAAGSDVPNMAEISSGYGDMFTRSTSVHVNVPADIHNSSKAVDQPEARAGGILLYSLTVDNSGDLSTPFCVTDTLDANTTFVEFYGIPDGDYGYAGGVITWTGALEGMIQAQLNFRARINLDVTGTVTNVAYFDDLAGGIYSDTAATSIFEPALDAVKRSSPAGMVAAGEILRYTIVMSNTSEVISNITLTDTIPDFTLYEPGSAEITPGYNPPLYISPNIVWEDDIRAGRVLVLSFDVRVDQGISDGVVISNIAWLRESDDPLFSISVVNVVGQVDYQIYLPVVLKNN